jgi:polyisoprenoid-binding protein YceI
MKELCTLTPSPSPWKGEGNFVALRGKFVLPALALAAAAGAFAATAQTVDAAKSRISFVSRQMNVPVEGKFGRFEAQLAWDTARPESSRARLEVDLASIDTGLAEADEEVRTKGWFDVKNHPKAVFVSSGVRPLGGGRYEVSGKMTIKGQTRDVAAPFVVKEQGGATVFEGEFPLRRLQFGIGEGQWADTSVVANEVQVRFRIVTAGAPAPASKR